jgi:D-glycero-D-manno-heptose 1,7-bisphosphate phosphatase
MYDPILFKPFSFAGAAIRRLNDSGFKAVLITNQSGIGRGYFEEATVERVHELLRWELERHGARLDGIYVCPHHPDEGCCCRKPRPGMLQKAARDLDIDLSESYVIGDKYADVGAAHAVGARSILVLTGYGRKQYEQFKAEEHQPHLIADDLMAAVNAIVNGVLE